MRLLLLMTMLVFIGCEKEHGQKKLSSDQLRIAVKMETDFQMATIYNDSLINAINGSLPNSDSARIYYFDKMHHQYDSEFDKCHSQYEHSLESADHSHNSSDMVVMHNTNGSMMEQCKCCANGGHKADIHQKMTSLRILHARYYY